jgi:hypothetical protein
VDHVRATLKPSSWSGLADFGDAVRESYRKNLWAGMEHHVEIFVEKDAVAGTIQPVTEEYNIHLRVLRGYSSVSFAGEVADLWEQIEKPVYAYYLGDFDPSGFDLERDLREKLQRYSHRFDYFLMYDRDFAPRPKHVNDGANRTVWSRLAVVEQDFSEFKLIELPVKKSDKRAARFLDDYGSRCAEVDAIPPSELRRRVQEAIESHIHAERWSRLREVERLEQETLETIVQKWGDQEKANLDSVSSK